MLAYHRVADPAAPGFQGDPGNVSATPGEFARQMDLPGVLFLTTGPLDGGPALSRDRIAEAFAACGAEAAEADLPVVGTRSWEGDAGRDRVRREFTAAVERLPPQRRTRALEGLGAALGVGVPRGPPGLYLGWDGVRALEGWAVGSRTVDHVVVTSVDPGEAAGQIGEAARPIREENGGDVAAFVYPNGMPGDFGGEASLAVARAGMQIAFTLRPGPSRLAEVRRDPLAVRRVLVEHRDGRAGFEAKVAGLPRLGVLR